MPSFARLVTLLNKKPEKGNPQTFDKLSDDTITISEMMEAKFMKAQYCKVQVW